jgi:hypothetical protein
MKVNLNNKSVNQGGPSMMQPQQQVDPAILQISEFFSTSVDEGKKPEEVVISLMEQKVDQNTIAQALMNMGYAEEDLTILFKNVESLTKPKPPSNQQINNNPQQLSRDQAIQEGRPAMVSIDPIEMANDGKETGNCTPEQIASGTCGAWDGTDLVVNMNSQGVIQNPNINTNNDEGMIGGSPMYVNPAAFAENGNKKNLGSIANFLLESNETLFDGDLNSRGEKKGALRDWKTKALNNKIDKQLNANYTATLDFSDENIGAIGNWYNQYMEENPERNELDQIINNIPPPEESKISKAGNQALDWMNDKGADLTGSAKETYDALRKKLGFRYGGDLDKAQFAGQPEEFPDDQYNLLPDFNPNDPNFDMSKFLQEGDFGLNNAFPEDVIAANDQLRADDAEAAYQEANRVPSADELFAKINMPTVEADYGGLQGTIDRALDSNLAKGFGAISDVAVKGAGLLTDFLDTSVEDAKIDNYNTFALADNVYGTKTNAFNKRGKTDINTGQSGSDSDKVTGLFMSKGGGVNNEGFKALPSAVQHNILSNLAYGGSTGPEAYLANRDMVIKREMAKAQFGNGETEGMRQREGSYNPPNRKYTLDPRFKVEIQKLSPDGKNIITEKNGMTILTDNPYDNQDAKSQLQLLDLKYKLAKLKAQAVAKLKLQRLDEQKEGGETVSVDPSMLAKLIAAGADIEML